MLFFILINASKEINNMEIYTNYQNYGCSFVIDENFIPEKLSSVQEECYNNLQNDISPNYNIIAYILDPFDHKKCYLFIENTLSKNIKHHTINFENHLSVQKVKREILFEETNTNHLFEKYFIKNVFFIEDTENYIKQLIEHVFDYFNLFNILIHCFQCLLNKLDYKISTIFCFECKIFEKALNIKISNIYQKFYNFLNTCKIILNIKLKITYLNSVNNTIKINLNILQNFFIDMILVSSDFKTFSIEKKIEIINNFTDTTYQCCIRNKIAMKSINRYTLFQIKLIQNKLYQFTLILCWIKLIKNQKYYINVRKMLRLTIYIFIDLKNKNYDYNDPDTLQLIYRITKLDDVKPIKDIIFNNMCNLDQPHDKHMQNIIIKRYYFFLTHFNEHNSFFLRNLIFEHQKFELTWIFIRCCIITQYKILNIVI